jgi:hypothetical protein
MHRLDRAALGPWEPKVRIHLPPAAGQDQTAHSSGLRLLSNVGSVAANDGLRRVFLAGSGRQCREVSAPRLHPLREQLERYRDGLSSPRFLLRDNSYPDRGLRTINRRLMQDGKEPARAKLTPQSALRIPFLPRSHAHRQVAQRVRVPARRTGADGRSRQRNRPSRAADRSKSS